MVSGNHNKLLKKILFVVIDLYGPQTSYPLPRRPVSCNCQRKSKTGYIRQRSRFQDLPCVSLRVQRKISLSSLKREKRERSSKTTSVANSIEEAHTISNAIGRI